MGRLGSLEALGDRGALAVEADGRTARRVAVERLRANWGLLDPEERLLLKLHLEAGGSLEEIARVMGRHPSTVCRRIQRMIRRLCDETYDRCAVAGASFGPAELAVVRDHFVRGLSLARICRDHHLCYYRVHAIVQKARRHTGTAARPARRYRSP
jgi:DNA-directed RNA polymerase specialized sigma24 family protein